MRQAVDIRREIAATEAVLRALKTELDEVVNGPNRRRNAAIIAAFDAGGVTCDIARSMKLPYPLVQGVLWRSGRTLGGRTIRNPVVAEELSLDAVSA